MAILNKGQTFSDGEQVTSAKLNTAVGGATFASGAVDDVSTQLSGGAIIVKDGGVGTAKIADDAVTPAKIADSAVTFAKLDNVIDDDTMATASATTLATSESIKAYVDALEQYQLKYSGSTGTISVTTSFVDWDLSSVVGSNRAMVIIELWDSSAFISLIAKTKGSLVEPLLGNSNAGWGASGLAVSSTNQGGTIAVVTNELGVIQIKATSSAYAINYKIQAYQKLA